MEKLQNIEELVSRLKPGTSLWRDFAVNVNTGIHIADVPFTETDKGNYTARLEFVSGWLFEPHVWNRQHKPHGLIVFVDKVPPDDWTHLIVKKVSHNCKSLTAVYGGPLPGMDEYKRFCLESYRLRSACLNEAVEQKLEKGLSLKISVPANQHRMIVGTYWENQGLRPAYHYYESK